MSRKRSSFPLTAFILTPKEEEYLALSRAGKSHSQIAKIYGLKSTTAISHTLISAAEKDRIIQLHDKREYGETSLKTARGRVRMEGTK